MAAGIGFAVIEFDLILAGAVMGRILEMQAPGFFRIAWLRDRDGIRLDDGLRQFFHRRTVIIQSPQILLGRLPGKIAQMRAMPRRKGGSLGGWGWISGHDLTAPEFLECGPRLGQCESQIRSSRKIELHPKQAEGIQGMQILS